MYFKEADKQILKDLKDSNKLLKHETLVHSYPMCDRTNEPLISYEQSLLGMSLLKRLKRC